LADPSTGVSNRDAILNAENWGKPGNVGEERGKKRGREGRMWMYMWMWMWMWMDD